MTIGKILFRWLALWSLVFWIGGFTFYGGVVIPVLHDQLGSVLETGLVTQRVTDLLNLIGLVAVVLGWLRTLIERPAGDRGRVAWRGDVVALAIISLCLAALVLLHRRLDDLLLRGELAGFYPVHRAYLWVSTLQWLVSMALLTRWAGAGRGAGLMSRAENPQVSGRSYTA